MPPDSPYPTPFDSATFLFPAEWHALSDLLGGDNGLLVLRDGAIMHLNAYLAQQLGFDETELLGKPVESLFPSGNGPTTPAGKPQAADGANIRLRSRNGDAVEFHLAENRVDTLNDARCTIWVLQPPHGHREEAPLGAPARAQAITENLPELVCVCDAGMAVSYANESFSAIAGDAEDALSARVHDEDRAKLHAALEQAVAAGTGASVPVAFRLRTRDGTWRQLAGHARNLLAHQEVAGLLLSMRDATQDLSQQQHIAAEKKRQLHYLNRLLRIAQQPHANLASSLKVILKAAAKALGIQRSAYWELGDDPSAACCVMAYDDVRQNLVDEIPDAVFMTEFHPLLQQVLRSEKALVVGDVDQDPRTTAHCEYFHAAAIKAVIIVPVQGVENPSGILVLSDPGQPRQWRKDEAEFADNVAGLIAQVWREVERTRATSQLRPPAHRDSLTGLPNRHFLFEQADDIFPQAAANSSTLAAFFIDLDGFKKINDAHGHAIGDELLKAAALRLKNMVRNDDILVRLGGDEFMLLARNLNDKRIADDIGLQIVDTIRGTFGIRGIELQVSVSVGIALYPSDGRDLDTLMKKADIAMLRAKSAGRDQYRTFGQRTSGTASDHPLPARELRRAIEERELQHYYQPQIDLRTGKVRCVEALLRWRHPERGILLPASFLPLAEDSGLSRHISTWVLNDACRQLNDWDRQGMDEFKLAINLSATQLMERRLVATLENALDRSGIDGHRLEWEITENTMMQNNSMTESLLERIVEMRIGLSIDDFGTGFSNMSYLRRYPVHKVKIDGSLVSGLPANPDACAVTAATISMTQRLGIEVVAEGVETQEQMEYLRDQGCDIAQGYYFTQPLTAEQFEKWLIRH